MARADGEGDLHPFAQQAARHRALQLQVTAIAANQHGGHGTGVTVLALPGYRVVWVGLQQATSLHILAAKVVAIEVPAINGLIHTRNVNPWASRLIPERRAVGVQIVTIVPWAIDERFGVNKESVGKAALARLLIGQQVAKLKLKVDQ